MILHTDSFRNRVANCAQVSAHPIGQQKRIASTQFTADFSGPGTTYFGYNDGYAWSFNQAAQFDASFVKLREISFSYNIPRTMIFDLVTDLWSDTPYSMANLGETGTVEAISPVYDSQESIYTGVIADLDKANTLLSQTKTSFETISSGANVYYNGDPTKWRKFANTLMLRYYMRLSVKKPDIAKAGIEKI